SSDRRIAHPQLAQLAHGRNRGETIRTETLYSATLMIDSDQQRLVTHGMNTPAQRLQLLAVRKIAGKQNDTTHQRVLQPASLCSSQAGAFYVHHNGARRQCHWLGRYFVLALLFAHAYSLDDSVAIA